MSENGKTYLLGIVKWFDEKKGFGFIELPDSTPDVFIHANQLRKSGLEDTLSQGDKVRFVTGTGPKGSFATEISVLPPGT